MKSRIKKYVRNILISTFIMLVLFVGAGVGYTWYMGQNSSSDKSVLAEPVEYKPPTVIKPTQPTANTKVGASVQMITSPILPGSNASITVRTVATASCSISVIYKETPSTDSGLVIKKADEYGMVSWSWTVEDSVPLGKWPVKVTCAYGESSAQVIGDLVVSEKVD